MSFQALTFGAMYQTLSQILFETVFQTRDFKRTVRLTEVDRTINRIHIVFAFFVKIQLMSLFRLRYE